MPPPFKPSSLNEIPEILSKAAPEVGRALETVLPHAVRPVTSPSEIGKILAEQRAAQTKELGELALETANVSSAQEDMMLGGNGDGSKLPPGAPFDPPFPDPESIQPQHVSTLEGLKVRFTRSLPGRAIGAARKALVNPTARGVSDIADLAFSSHSVDTFQRLAPDVFKTLNKAVPELQKMAPSAQKQVLFNLNRYIDGEIDQSMLKGLHPELNAQFYGLTEAYKQKFAENSQRVEALFPGWGQMNPGEELATDIAPDYATKMYWRFLLEPGEWAKIMRKDEQGYAHLKDAIKNDVYRTKEHATLSEADRDALAEDHLDFLLGDPEVLASGRVDPEGAWRQSVSKAGGSLKRRETLTWWKKAALGEIDNAFVRMSETMSRQEQLILRGSLWDEISRNPKYASPGDAAGLAKQMGHTEWLPNNPALYGKAAGMRVSKDVMEAMIRAPMAQRNATTWVTKSVNALKFASTVGNLGSWVTNFGANAQNAAMSNLVDPWTSPLRVGKGMHMFAQDLKAFSAAPGLKGAVPSKFVEGTGELGRSRFQRAMELGVVGSEFSTAEFREAGHEWLRTLGEEAKRNGGKINPLDLFPRLLRKAGKTKEALAKKYSAIDTLWKYATYTSGLEKGGIDTLTNKIDLEKAIEFIGKRHRPGMDEAAIRKAVELEVAQRIHYAFPMLDRVGEGVAKAGKWGGTIINPYLKVKVELMRNYAQLPARIATEKGMLANMLGYTAVAGGMYFALKQARAAMGVNQDHVDAAFASAPAAVQRYKPGAMALWSRNSDTGRLTFVDMTQMFEPFSWIQGNPETSMPTRALANIAYSSVDGSLLEPALAGLMNYGGVPIPGYEQRNEPEWKQDGANLLREGIMRFAPGTLRNTYTTAVRGGIGFAQPGTSGPTREPQSGLTTGFNMGLGPNRIFEAGSHNDRMSAIKSLDDAITAAEKEMDRIGRMREGQSTGTGSLPLDKQAALDEQLKVLQRRVTEMNNLQEKLRKAQ